ncbi:unnamed protein product [Kuraishia capsulata CBS 1993]|uniref:DNA repair protein rhp7 treble clef domain-containing protein n=1 Tax=Kuraishia capsulata CBS 1993 TaxID=1382522 RepID=W6MTG8_9ASCO|nr:uncharacterized protein KUCA_T00006009001 [Kuraishia capsulata CBS 1993]CDK30014.1 unnamed protein product [Kuraishia capsulata CBS 1993]
MRSRRNETNEESSVRGPNSALTAFLREQGITAEVIERRNRQREEQEELERAAVTQRVATDANSDIEELVDAATSKRRAADVSDDDGDDGNHDRDPDGKSYCLDCDVEFKITVLSKRAERNGRAGYLCADCTLIQQRKARNARRNEVEARKRRKKVAAALLDKQEYKLPSLQDICVKLISQNIEEVDAFGDIGTVNMRKISKILSKNRSLNGHTMTLFLDAGLKELEFWDCSNMDSDSYTKIAAFCPRIERLTLWMCGQLHNDNLRYIATNLPNLTHLTLNGPFLISDSCWQDFFEIVGSRLKGFHILNTHRFSNDSMVSLLENCGSGLEELTISRMDGLDSKPVYDILPHYLTKLKHLEISYPTKEELVDDALIVNLLSVNGETLETLILDGCSGLTDATLVSGIRPFCPSLRKLSLGLLDQITDDGASQLFTDWDINDGLMEVSLRRCTALTDAGVYPMLEHSRSTLIELNLNSVYGITTQMFQDWSRNLKLGLLTSLDIGFVQSVNDKAVSILGRVCPKLTILEVYGCNNCTQEATVRSGLRLIGRQTDNF